MTAMSLPALGAITAWSDVDAVGTVTLTDGAKLRLGASACAGFRPLLGLDVRVLSVATHPLGGLKVERAEPASVAAYDARVTLDEPEPSDASAIGFAKTLGWAAVLFPRAPGSGRDGARKLTEDAGLARLGAKVELSSHGRSITVGTLTFQMAIARAAAFASAQVPHAGFVVLSGGIPSFEVRARDILGRSAPDPWGAHGKLRALTKLVAAFVRASGDECFVWFPVSGGIVGARDFLARAGDLDDDANRPMPLYVDVVDAADGTARTVGMALAGFPDIRARADDEGARRAVLRTMVAHNRTVAGERITFEDATFDVGDVVEDVLSVRRV